ncbi:hypothetical protein [Streptomyces nigrescens]
MHRKLIAALAASLILTGGLTGTAAADNTSSGTEAKKAHCSRWKAVDGKGGQVTYQECARKKNGHGQRLVRGVVNDQKDHNHKCVYARVVFDPSGKVRSYKDCGGKQTRYNTGWHNARNARVYGSAPG